MGAHRLIALALASGALTAQAAQAAPTWHGVAAGVPATVRLLSVAATRTGAGDVVVAVGRDDATGQAAIYRFANGAWQQDLVAAAPAQLTRVALSGGHAYAIGGTALLTLADAAAPGSATWSALTAPGSAELTGLAAASDGSARYLGAADGRLYSFTDAGATALNDTQGQVVPPNGGVTAVAAGAGGAGVAAAKRQDPNSRFFALGSGGVTPQAAVDGGSCGADPVAVAIGGSAALAIDGACWWDAVNGVWSQHGTDGAFLLGGVALHDVALAPDGAAGAIAGESGGGQGTLWRRVAQFGWSAATGVSAAPLRGVSVIAADDMWAVGDGGAVLHLFEDPPAPAGADDTGAGASSSAGGDGTGSTTTTSGASGSGSTSGSGSSRTPTGLKIIIDDPSGVHRETVGPTYSTSGSSPKRGPARARRLLRITRVRLVRSGLRIDFRLAARARVTAVAMRGKQAIGRIRPRVFPRGAGRIVLRFRGAKPPTTLRIVARRSVKSRAPARPVAS